jgi:phage baseplate assembly protein W
MSGLSVNDARRIGDAEHLGQSITDILTTPIGRRVMRRDYGSALFDLIDAPMNGETLVDVYAATAEALDRWEPRLTLLRVQLADAVPGRLTLAIEAEADGQTIRFNPVIGAAA